MGRGPTAYFLFADEHRAECKAELQAGEQKAGVAQVAKLIGQKWGALTDAEKQAYKERAAALQGEHSAAACCAAGLELGLAAAASCRHCAAARSLARLAGVVAPLPALTPSPSQP